MLAEGSIKVYLKEILRALYKFYDYEYPEIQGMVKTISELLGIYVSANFYLPILLEDVRNPDNTISQRMVSNITVGLLHKTRIPYSLERPGTVHHE